MIHLYTRHATKNILFIIAMVLLAIAVVMIPWLIILGATLKGQVSVRMWSSTWIGLDCLEIIGLFATSVLLLKRKTYVMIAATFTATLFLIDAWFDVMLAQAGSAWFGAVVSGFFVEVPLSLFLFFLAIIAPSLIDDSDQTAIQAKRYIGFVRSHIGSILLRIKSRKYS